MLMRKGAGKLWPPTVSLMRMVRAVKKHSDDPCNNMELSKLRLKSVFSREGGVLKKHSRKVPRRCVGVWRRNEIAKKWFAKRTPKI
jgi:hypothetical protein